MGVSHAISAIDWSDGVKFSGLLAGQFGTNRRQIEPVAQRLDTERALVKIIIFYYSTTYSKRFWPRIFYLNSNG